MTVDATNIQQLTDCFPFWQVPYNLQEFTKVENDTNKVLLLDIFIKEVNKVLNEIVKKECLGFNADFEHEKLLVIYSLLEYFLDFKSNLSGCADDIAQAIKDLKEEYKLSCVKAGIICKYGLTDLYNEMYDTLRIPREGTTSLGLGSMTINGNECNIFKIKRTR
jgi:hypothetical protein